MNAPVVGVSKDTISRDLLGVSPDTPATCPGWCSDHQPHGTHRHPVGTLGVAVEWCPEDGFGAPVIYVPATDVDPMNASIDYARRLGADLTAAVELIEGDASA